MAIRWIMLFWLVDPEMPIIQDVIVGASGRDALVQNRRRS